MEARSNAETVGARTSRPWVGLGVLILTLVAFCLRAPGLASFAPNHWDEGLAWRGARWFASLGAEGHYSPTHAPPLASSLFALVERLLAALGLAQGPAAAVWANVVAGSLLVPAAFALGRALAGDRGGLAAAALIVLSPLHLAFSRTLLTDTFYSLFLVTSLALGMAALRTPTRGRWFRAGLAVALLQGTKYNGFLMLAPLGMAALVLRERSWKGREVGIDAVLFAAPTLLVMGGNLGAIAALGSLPDFFEHYSGYIGEATGLRELVLTLGYFGFGSLVLLGLAMGGVVASLWPGRGDARSSLSLRIVTVAAVVLYLGFAARYVLYLRLLVPVVTLGLVLLGAQLARCPGGRSASGIGVVLVLALQAHAWLQPVYPQPEGFDGYGRAAERIDALPVELPRLIAGQQFVWPELEGTVVFGTPWSAGDLLAGGGEVVLVYDIGAFSRLRDWSLESLHQRFQLPPYAERLQREPATLGVDCLQNNLGLSGLGRLRPGEDLARRALGIHWIRIDAQELLGLCAR